MKTQKSPEDQLRELGFEIIQSTNGNVSIAYNPHELLTKLDENPLISMERYEQLRCDPYIAYYTQVSIEQLKDDYPANDPSTQCGINKSNHEAHQIICDLEKVIKNLLNENRIQQLFDFLPYTKAGQFSKSKRITLYSTGITFTEQYDYFSQSQIALQLIPLELWSYKGLDTKLNNIALLIINPKAKPSKKDDDIIDDNGNFKKAAVKKRNKYLKSTDLVPGKSYIDNKGVEYLYMGSLIVEYDDPLSPCKNQHVKIYAEPCYQKINKTVGDEITKSSDIMDFLRHRFSKAPSTDILKGMDYYTEKRFVSVEKTYFPPLGDQPIQAQINVTSKDKHTLNINITQRHAPNEYVITQKSTISQLQELGFHIVRNPNNGVSIAYNTHDLLTRLDEDRETRLDKYVQLHCNPHIAPYAQISIEQLKRNYPANDFSVQSLTNKSKHDLHKIVCDLEKIIKSLLNEDRIQQLFDFLPYTRSGKFNKGEDITLYSTGIIDTVNDSWNIPYQIVLQLVPVKLWSESSHDIKSDDVALLIINPIVKIAKTTKDDIIDSSGNFKKISNK